MPDKQARDEAFGAVKEEAKAHLTETLGEDALAERGQEFGAAWKSLQKKVMRRRVIEQGVRLDGRGATDIRPLSAEVGVLPRAHGSALFSRGETQVLNVATLGMLRMTQMIDTLDPEDSQALHAPLQLPAVLAPGRPAAWARRGAARSGTARSPSAPCSRWCRTRRSSPTRCGS